jgi:hypothetical protein
MTMEQQIAEALARERHRQERDYLVGDLFFYCDNQDCTARQITVRIKSNSEEDPTTIHCPLCGQEPMFDGYREMKP